jgi:hypothetical protein
MYFFRFLSLLVAIFILAACAEKEQTKEDATVAETAADETRSEVPELWEFHEVIYQIWHQAWPEKDTKMLTELIPDIEEGFAKLSDAELPGILRDKQDDWSKGIESMAKIIANYKEAAAAGQEEALLKAAEDLHTQFENLVRLIRPVMKEIDQFHQELYMLYHYYLPDYDLQKIRTSTAELIKRMEPVNAATLPARLSNKQEAFDQAKKSLLEALLQLQEVSKGDPERAVVEKSIEKVHDQYQALIAVFE